MVQNSVWNSLPADVKNCENLYHLLRKKLLNGAYRVNVMGLLYNDRHDISPPPI